MTSKRRQTDIASDVAIGAKIRARRMELEISQEKLGRELGLSFQQVQKYEKGKNRVTVTRLQEIARVLKTDISHFLDDAGRAREVTPVTAFLATKEGNDLIKAAMRLSKSEKEKLRAVIELARTLGNKKEGIKQRC